MKRRVDALTYHRMPPPDTLTTQENWKRLSTIGVAIRVSEQDGEETGDVRHYVSATKMAVRRFAERVRGHWKIENTLRWCLDVTFQVDSSRVRNHHAHYLAWLKRFALSLLEQQSDKESIATRRRLAAWNPEYLAKVAGLARD